MREAQREEVTPGIDDAARKFHLIDWYVRWARGCVGSLFFVLPETMRGDWEARMQTTGCERVWWYGPNGRLTLPPQLSGVGFWVVNGGLFPLVNWDAADEAAGRHQCDVLVFGPPGSVSSSQYPESLVVDESGRVLRVERHYFDSPAFTDVAYGPISFCFVTGSQRDQALAHLIVRGWDLESIRSLAESAAVEWCTAPSVLSSLAGANLRRGPTERSAREDGSTGSTTAGGTALLERAGAAVEPLRTNGHSARRDRNGKPGVERANAPNESSVAAEATLPDSPVTWAGPLSALAPLETPPQGVYPYIKRVLDIAFSLAALTVSSPLFLAIAVIVKVTSRGPIFYADRRQGRGGKEFLCFKFRTMVADAAARQAELRRLNEVDGPQFKMADDPRLTPIGRWLRKYNVDELPQFINVLWGQMSLVGPRPSPDRENQLCPGWRRTRLSLRPGITGLWQVLRLGDAGASDFQEWIYYDLEYARHQSFWLDCLILAYTPFTVWKTHLLANLARNLAKRGICVEADAMHRRRGGLTES